MLTTERPTPAPAEPVMTVYQRNGYRNRAHYLASLADEFGVPVRTVHALASILGPNEDFDGLVTGIEDAIDMGEL